MTIRFLSRGEKTQITGVEICDFGEIKVATFRGSKFCLLVYQFETKPFDAGFVEIGKRSI